MDLRCHANAWLPHDFWKDILENGNGSGSRMFLQVNLKYHTFTSFYWQKLTALFIKECCIPISHTSKHQADKLGRLTFLQALAGRASSTNLGPPSPIWCLPSISWGCKKDLSIICKFSDERQGFVNIFWILKISQWSIFTRKDYLSDNLCCKLYYSLFSIGFVYHILFS